MRRIAISAVVAVAACSPEPTAPADLEPPAALEEPAEIRELPPVPFWARGPACCIDGWGGISFYVQDPSSIPPDFNFLDFFDPRALSAEWAVAGFGIFKNPASPEMTELHGLGAVPMWFFPSDDIAAMVADGIVTLAELESYGPVKGHAHHFNEVFVPLTAGSTQARHHLVARGDLDDGGVFRMVWNHRVNQNTGDSTLDGQIVLRLQ